MIVSDQSSKAITSIHQFSRRPHLRRSGVAAAAAAACALLALAGLGHGAGPSLAATPGAGGGPVAAAPTETKPRLTLKADRGLFDDAWTLDAAGSRLAVVHTDRETFQRVRIFDLDRGADAQMAAVEFDLPAAPRELESLVFPPRGSGLLLVRAGADADTRVLELLDCQSAPGKPLGVTGAVSAFAFATVDLAAESAPSLLVTLQRRAGRAGATNYLVAGLRLPTLRPAGRPRTYAVGTDGMLGGYRLLPVGFFDGYSKMLTQRPGAFDRKKDARQPDAQATIDLISGKVSADRPLGDLYAWARASRLRREHPNRTAFVLTGDALAATPDANASAGDSASSVQLVDPAGRVWPLSLAVPFRLYDRFSLKDQEGPDAGLVHFGIHVDPVNADAVARKKADSPFLDLYSVPVERPTEVRWRARVALDAQPTVWMVAGNRLVVLRRFKSFARGGDRVDVYDLRP